MGHFSGTLDSTAPSGALTRGAWPCATSKSTMRTSTATPINAPPTTSLVPNVSEAPAHTSPDSLDVHHLLLNLKIKENNLPRIKPKRESILKMRVALFPDVQPRSIIADTRREPRWTYMSFAKIDDFKRRVVYTEESFGNLPYYICLPM